MKPGSGGEGANLSQTQVECVVQQTVLTLLLSLNSLKLIHFGMSTSPLLSLSVAPSVSDKPLVCVCATHKHALALSLSLSAALSRSEQTAS